MKWIEKHFDDNEKQRHFSRTKKHPKSCRTGGTLPDIAEFLGIKEVNKIFQILFEVCILKEYNEREENLFIARKVKNTGTILLK